MEHIEDRLQRNLDGVLKQAFDQTQAEIHVESGALKASGSWSSSIDESGDYVGEIRYGGALAPHAIYELNRKGHSTLDEVLPRYEQAFRESIVTALSE